METFEKTLETLLRKVTREELSKFKIFENSKLDEIKLIDRKGAMKLMSCSSGTITNLIDSGQLNHKRIGNKIYFTLKDIESFIESCEVKAL